MNNEIKKDAQIIDDKYSNFSKYISKDNILQEEEFKINIFKEDSLIVFRTIYFDSDMIVFKNNNIYISVNDHKNNEIKININKLSFIDCKFSANIFFKDNLDSLEIHRCIFEERCYINNQYENNDNTIEINNLKIKETIFKNNFKLHNTIINKFEIRDTDFIKNADFFKSVFYLGINNNTISFHAINFNELALFGDTKFHKFLEFKYVAFKGYTHFRSATFNEGLDLEYANIEKEMNFFNIHKLSNEKSKKYTSQETYRIIKYQLQKVGNIIQSNKYQALELEKRKENVCDKCNYKSFLDCIILHIHNISSSHSTNWLLALAWIIIIGISTTYFLTKDININNIIQYMSILNKYSEFKINETIIYGIVMFNKISLGYLYYQFITAIRKDTRK